jgi:hypothetical protein
MLDLHECQACNMGGELTKSFTKKIAFDCDYNCCIGHFAFQYNEFSFHSQKFIEKPVD